MHRNYTYNRYFVNKLTTLSIYQKSFINDNIVNKIKYVYQNINIYLRKSREKSITSKGCVVASFILLK